MRRVAATAIGLAATGIGLAALTLSLWAAYLAAPGATHPHRWNGGAVRLFSDRPIPEDAAARIDREVAGRLAASPFAWSAGAHAVVIDHAPWRRRLAFAMIPAAAAINYAPLGSASYLRPANIAANRVTSPSGEQVPPPRTLAYYAAHEIAHALTAEAMGGCAYRMELLVWVREGLAEYVALGPGAARTLSQGQPREAVRTAATRHLYTGYHLAVECALEGQGWPLNRLLATRTPYEAAFEALVGPDLACREDPGST